MRGLLASRIVTRTTLDLDPTILSELRQRAKREGKSMGQVASEVLAPGLRANGGPEPEPFLWESWDMGEPLVDLEDKDAVQRILDEQAGWHWRQR